VTGALSLLGGLAVIACVERPSVRRHVTPRETIRG
jgi:hypothetical protein